MIQIPNPCKEDFSQMTATEKGAFCSKCKHDTYDFRQMSQYQIAKTIKDHGDGQLCGQINNTQLDDFNAGFVSWKRQGRKTFQSKFIMALLLVFGLGLFSCETEDEQLIQSVAKIEIAQEVDQTERFVQQIEMIEDLELIQMLDVIDVEMEAEVRVCNQILETRYDEQIIDKPYEGEIYRTAGIMIADERPQLLEYIEVVVSDSIESKIDMNNIEIIHADFQAKAFPNPTQFNSTLSFEVPSEGNYQVVMYDMNGRQVRDIHTGHLFEGNQRFEIDMYELNSGLFFVNIISDEHTETVKIQKVN
ncbi:MAG: hypothetical protein ACI857_000440 [Arenicella sp.]|jgi:hypothetical protein